MNGLKWFVILILFEMMMMAMTVTSASKMIFDVISFLFNCLRKLFIGYPSAETSSKGLNIVLMPDAVNNYLTVNLQIYKK